MLQQRERPHVHRFVVVGQLQAGKHAPDDQGFAAARLAQNADAQIAGLEMLGGNGVAQIHQPLLPAGGIVFGEHKRIAGKFHGIHPFLHAIQHHCMRKAVALQCKKLRKSIKS